MSLRAGIPLISEVEALVRTELYQELSAYAEAFFRANRRSLWLYALRHSANPVRQWSRRWEYAFTVERAREHLRQCAERPLRVLDAGSGVTFLPFYLSQSLPSTELVCCDANKAYGKILARINARRQDAKVAFACAWLEDLPFPDESFDLVYCISVLEHTRAYGPVLDEFERVLRPGGILVATFDISLDGRAEILPGKARELVERITSDFACPREVDLIRELDRLKEPGEILTTDYAKREQPGALPWRYPVLKSMYDLLRGRAWSGGFYSATVFCLDARLERFSKH